MNLRDGHIQPFLSQSVPSKPQIMGVLNVTPDSFYDGGRFIQSHKGELNLDKACEAAIKMAAEGATIIDVGGESTRPGAEEVSVQQEMDRVLPVIERIVKEVDATVSVDTSSPVLMAEAAAAGAGLLNDVRAFTKQDALSVAAKTELPICIMHMQGTPSNMQHSPTYESVTAEVCEFLSQRAQSAIDAGVKSENIIVDPGFGFGKTDMHNIQLLRLLGEICQLGFPVLAGLSRKSMIGRLLGREPEERLAGSLALAMLAVQAGASIIRVHDVPQTRDVLTLLELVSQQPHEPSTLY